MTEQDDANRRGLHSPRYERARADLRMALAPHLKRSDWVYEEIESIITAGQLKSSKPESVVNAGVRDLLLLLLTKALKTHRAIRVTALEGCGQDAQVLVRVLFETAFAMNWILAEDTLRRARIYAAYGDQRDLVAANERAITPGLEQDAQRRVAQAQARVNEWASLISSDDLEASKAHWSGAGNLRNAAGKLDDWLVAYQTVYRGTSSFAHGADSLRHANYRGDAPVYKLLPGDDEAVGVLTVGSTLLWAAASALNDRWGLGRDESMDSIKRTVIERPDRDPPLKGGNA